MALSGNTSIAEESIKALRQLRSDLELTNEQMKKEIARLRQVYDDNKAGLGPHSDAIDALLTDMESQVDTANVPTKTLVLKLTAAAAVRENVLKSRVYHR